MAFEIGTASAADVTLMAEWAAAENWNPGLTDARAFIVADPRGFLVGRMNGEPVTAHEASGREKRAQELETMKRADLMAPPRSFD